MNTNPLQLDVVDNILGAVRQRFKDYLEEHKHRKTTERFAILEIIYSYEGHFDIDSLYKLMLKHHQRVSKTTIYNCLELLLDCNLVIKHQFTPGLSHYERAYNAQKHDHLICTECGQVIEFSDQRIYEIKKTAGRLKNFTVSHHSLYIYGICQTCEEKKQQKIETY